MDKSDKLAVEKLQKNYYLIAGILFQVDLPEKNVVEKLLPSFSPFKVRKNEASASITVQVTQGMPSVDLHKAKLLSDISVEWRDRFKFYEAADCYITIITSESKEKAWYMISTKDFYFSKIHAPATDLGPSNGVLSWLLMVAFGQASLHSNAMLIHASVVENGEHAYAFLGKSGTGKSTHSRLWLQHIPGFSLLNDDNPVLRIEESGEVMVYGSPWSGKTRCYVNKGVRLGGLIRLQQAKENNFVHKKDKEALLQVMPSCTAIRWNTSLFDSMVSLLTYVIHSVPVGLLSCLPDKEAAVLCYDKIKKYKV